MRQKVSLSIDSKLLELIDTRARIVKTTRSEYLRSLILKDLENELVKHSGIERRNHNGKDQRIISVNGGAPIADKKADNSDQP